MRSLKPLALLSLVLLFAGVAHAAPITVFEPTLLPQSDNHFDLGTSTNAWRKGYFHVICLTGDTCISTWPSGGGSSGTVTSVDVAGGTTGLTTSGGPITTSGSITLAGDLIVANGGTGSTTLSGLLKGNGTSGVRTAVANTDYQTPVSLTTTGSSGAATFDGTTLNIPQYSGGTSYSAAWPITLSGTTFGFNGLSTSTPGVVGNIPYFSSVNTFANVATSSASNGSGISLSGTAALVGSGGLTITNTGVTGIVTPQGTNASSITVATTSQTTNGLKVGLNITGGATLTFNPTISGTLTVAGGGTGQASFTSSQLLYGNLTNALTSVGTTSATIGTGLSYSGTFGALVGGGAGTLTNSGVISNSCPGGFLSCSGTNPSSFTLGTLGYGNGGTGSTTAPVGQLIYGGASSYQSVATSTLSATSPLTGSFTQIGSGGALGLGTVGIANGGTATTTGGNTNGVEYYDGSKITNSKNFGLNTSGGLTLTETRPATTTAITLDWSATGPQLDYQIGTSATTITLINATTTTFAGSRKLVELCNPGATAGAITWQGVEWSGGTAPTQTTTANVCDAYSLFITNATSTSAYKVFGAQSANFQ